MDLLVSNPRTLSPRRTVRTPTSTKNSDSAAEPFWVGLRI